MRGPDRSQPALPWLRRTANRVTRVALAGIVVLIATAGAAHSQPGDLFELRAGGDLDWTPTSGALLTSSGSRLTASGVLASPFGSAAYEVAAGPGVARASFAGTFTNPPLETRRLNPSTFARATTRLTVSGPDGIVNVRFKAHVDATVVHTCPADFICGSAVTVFVGDQNTVVVGPGGGASPNLLGLSVDAVPGGYRVHGDYVSAPRPVFANSPFDAQLSLQLHVGNLGRGTADSSSFDARGEVSFPATGSVLEVPDGYTVSGENVEDNHWTDPFAPPPAPDVELQFADGSFIGPDDVLDLGTTASGATSPPTTFTIANTGTAALQVQPLTAPTGFAVDDQPDGTVAPGATTAAGLTCTATNTGTAPIVLDDVVTVASDDPDEGSLDLAVRCTVLPEFPPEPDIELRDEGGTALLPPYVLDLGDVASGSPATAGYRIANVGTGPLSIANITHDAPPGLGDATSPGAGSVQPGASTTAAVSCGGINSGDATLNVLFRVRVVSDDPDESPADLLVRCHVLPQTKPDIALRDSDGAPLPPGAVVDAGDVPSGETATRSYFIGNEGDAVLTIVSVRATTPAFGSGLALDPDDTTIDPGEAARAQVSCGGTNTDPTEQFTKEVVFEVRIESDDPDESPASFGVRCGVLPARPDMTITLPDGSPMPFFTAPPPVPGLPPPPGSSYYLLDLGDASSGGFVAGGFRVANVGNAELYVSIEGGTPYDLGDFHFSVEPDTFQLAPGASKIVPVECGGTLPYPYVSVKIVSNAPGDHMRIVRVSCERPDTTPPTISLPGTMAIDATRPAGANVSYSVSAADNVDPAPQLSCLPASGSTFPIGTTTVNCTATDHSGNSASGSFTVTVRGATAQIAALVAKTEAFVDPPAIEAALRVMLRAASETLRAGRKPAACAALTAYIIGVRAVPGSVLTGSEKTQLTVDATRIRAVIPC